MNIEDTAEIAEIDAKAGTLVKRFKLTGCTDPSGLAIDLKAEANVLGLR